MWNMLGKGSADKIEIHSHAIGNIVCECTYKEHWYKAHLYIRNIRTRYIVYARTHFWYNC